MSIIKNLKKKHKKIDANAKKVTEQRLNDRMSDSWFNLQELKKLKLQVKDKINKLKI